MKRKNPELTALDSAVIRQAEYLIDHWPIEYYGKFGREADARLAALRKAVIERRGACNEFRPKDSMLLMCHCGRRRMEHNVKAIARWMEWTKREMKRQNELLHGVAS